MTAAKTVPDFTKVCRIGSTPRNGSVFVKIAYTAGKLSLTGVEGPLANGDAKGSCGQIDMYPWDIDQYAEGWSAETEAQLRQVWKEWHLNDMQAGCVHQRAEKWGDCPIDPSKPTNSYGKWCGENGPTTWNMLAWVTKKDHPQGLLCEPCPTCGYKYGSAWLKQEVPADVLAWLQALPNADRKPAWC